MPQLLPPTTPHAELASLALGDAFGSRSRPTVPAAAFEHSPESYAPTIPATAATEPCRAPHVVLPGSWLETYRIWRALGGGR